MTVSRMHWARFSMGHLLFLVLGIAVGIVCDNYLTSFFEVRNSREVHSFYVVGAVASPGEYQFVDPSLSLVEAIARAGGPNGNASQLKVTRKSTDGSQDVSVVDLKAAANAGGAIRPGDIIEVLVSESESLAFSDEQPAF